MEEVPSCGRCGEPIARDELSQGLAVRVDGNLVCPQCVDLLPGEAQVRINQLRALRGLSATTYRVVRERHPALACFTFTTAINVSQHRRQVRSTGQYEAPVLPAPAPATALAPPTDAVAPPQSAGVRPPPRWVLASAGAAIVVIAIVGAIIAGSRHAPPAAEQPVARPAPPPAPARGDFPRDPLKAWESASVDQRCPPALLDQIADELAVARARQLDDAEQAITGGELNQAASLLGAIATPDDFRFSRLRTREQDLQRRQLAARVAAEKPSPTRATSTVDPPALATREPPPTGDEVVAAAESPPTPTHQPPAKPSEPAAPGPAPAADCLLVPADQLLADKATWRRLEPGLRLIQATGEAHRSLRLAGGAYQVWVDVRAEVDQASLELSLGDQHCEPLEPKRMKRTAWLRLKPDVVALPAGECRLALALSGRGWMVNQIYLAGIDQGEPDAAVQAGKAQAQAPAWTPDVPTGPAGAATGPAVALWEPRFLGTFAEANPWEERSRAPAPLPGGIERVFESSDKDRKHQSLTLDLSAADTAAGGVALLLHPLRGDRTRLQATLTDRLDHSLVLPPITFAREGWNGQTIAFVGLDAKGFAADHVASLTLEDVANLSTSFIVAKVVTVARAEPTLEQLGLRPPALPPLAWRDLDRLLELAAAKRKAKGWRKDFDLAALRIFTIGGLGSTAPALKKALAEPLAGAALPNRLFVTLGPTLVFDETKVHWAVILARGGRDSGVSLTGLISDVDACLEHGAMPVAVIGAQSGAVDWDVVAQRLAHDRPGVPIIDVRGTMPTPGWIPGKPNETTQALFVDGIAELARRLRTLQNPKPARP